MRKKDRKERARGGCRWFWSCGVFDHSITGWRRAKERWALVGKGKGVGEIECSVTNKGFVGNVSRPGIV